jgi:hypothetical protein
MHPDAPYFSILFCLTPDDFTRQVEISAVTQWVNLIVFILTHPVNFPCGKKPEHL